MFRRTLTDKQWHKIEGLLPGKSGDPGRTGKDNRLFVEAVLWIARTGSPWRDLPPQLGRWHSAYVRFARWRDAGVWDRIAFALSKVHDLASVLIDSTIVRVHQHGCGACKKAGPQALGRSRGGLSTKLHFAIDAQANPLRMILTAGQVADIECAHHLIETLPLKALIADKGYDANALVHSVEATGAQVVIPPRSNRLVQRSYNRRLYRHRNMIERFFNRIKHFRRIATRYDKLAISYMAFVRIVCAVRPFC